MRAEHGLPDPADASVPMTDRSENVKSLVHQQVQHKLGRERVLKVAEPGGEQA